MHRKRRVSVWVIILLVLHGFSGACQPRAVLQVPDADRPSTSQIGPGEATRIALERLNLVEDPSRRTISVKRDGENWSVLVEPLPLTSGAFTIVIVSPQGETLAVYPGH